MIKLEVEGDPVARFRLNLEAGVRDSEFYFRCAFADPAGVYYLQGDVVENEEVIYETCLRQTDTGAPGPLQLAVEIPKCFNQLYPLDPALPSLKSALEGAELIASNWRVPYAQGQIRDVVSFSRIVGVPTLYWLLEQGFAGSVEEAIAYRTGRSF